MLATSTPRCEQNSYTEQLRDSRRRSLRPAMKFRKLRIAWSVFWGVAAVLLVVLWVRSYWQKYTLVIPRHGATIYLTSQFGEIECLYAIFNDGFGELADYAWDFTSHAVAPDQKQAGR